MKLSSAESWESVEKFDVCSSGIEDCKYNSKNGLDLYLGSNQRGKMTIKSRINFLLKIFGRILTISTILFIVSYYIFIYTNLPVILEISLANGVGLVDFSILVLFAGIILTNIERVLLSFKRLLLTTEFTGLDYILITALFWNIAWSTIPFGKVNWAYFPNVIRFLQILIYITTLMSISRIVCYIFTKNSFPDKKEINNLDILVDDPINDEKEDELNRKEIVNNINIVLDNNCQSNSFVIAITGQWGSGKTSVLNLVKNKLDKKRYITINFSPWFVSVGDLQTYELILNRYFKALEDAICREIYTSKLRTDIGKYIRLISPSIKSSPLSLDFIVDQIQPDVQELKELIGKSLSKISKKIIVFIDDLDRMNSQEIIYVLKLIRLCFDFNNVTYILCFDKIYLENQLEKEFKSDARNYLEKIIQIELLLPKNDPADIERMVQKNLTRVGELLSKDLLNQPNFSKRLRYIQNCINLWLNTPRSIKVFFNRYHLALRSLKEEVDFFDLFAIQLLAYRYPDIYNVVYLNQEFFVRHPDEKGIEVKRKEFFSNFLSDFKPPEEKEAIILLLRIMFETFDTQYRDDELWSVISEIIFPMRTYNGIFIADFFPRYFLFGVQKGSIPESIWRDFIEELNKETDHKTILNKYIKIFLEYASQKAWIDKLSYTVSDARIKREQLSPLLQGICETLEETVKPISDINILHSIEDLIFRLVIVVEENAQEIITNYCKNIYVLYDLLRKIDPDKNDDRFAKLYTSLRMYTKSILIELINKSNIFLIDDPLRNIYLLFRYLFDADEIKKYTWKYIETDPQNAITALLNLIIQRNIQSGDLVFEYLALRELFEPYKFLDKLLQTSTGHKYTELAIDAIKQGINNEKENKITNITINSEKYKTRDVF